jgi:hypothetical protein
LEWDKTRCPGSGATRYIHRRAPIAQLAEAPDLKSVQCRFESDWGHRAHANRRGSSVARHMLIARPVPLSECQPPIPLTLARCLEQLHDLVGHWQREKPWTSACGRRSDGRSPRPGTDLATHDPHHQELSDREGVAGGREDGQRRLALRLSSACDVIRPLRSPAGWTARPANAYGPTTTAPSIQWKVIRLIRTVIGAALTAVAISCAPLAHATPQDDKFLQAVAAAGIELPPDQAIADGQAACDNYGNTSGAVGQLGGLMAQGLSQRQINALIVAGFQAYCPDKLTLSTWNR